MTTPWSEDPAENEAIAQLEQNMRAAAAHLHTVSEAKYVTPAGSFSPER